MGGRWRGNGRGLMGAGGEGTSLCFGSSRRGIELGCGV